MAIGASRIEYLARRFVNKPPGSEDQREPIALVAGERGRVLDQPGDVGVQVRLAGRGLPIPGRLCLPSVPGAGRGQRREAGGWRAGRLVIAVPLLIRTLMPG